MQGALGLIHHRKLGVAVHGHSQRGGNRRLGSLESASSHTLSSEPRLHQTQSLMSPEGLYLPTSKSHQLLIPEPKIKNNQRWTCSLPQPVTSSGTSWDGVGTSPKSLHAAPPALTKGPLGSNFLWIRKACVTFLPGNDKWEKEKSVTGIRSQSVCYGHWYRIHKLDSNPKENV